MTELARYIENLLFSNDCVIVPQLGGFVTHHVPAHYNEAEGLYMPPSRSVGFNPQLQLNDGLLVQAYMLANPGISFPEANELLEADINLLKSQLQAEGEYLLEGVGCLSVGMDGKYTFKPATTGLISPDLYGMEPTPVSFIRPQAECKASRQRHLCPLKTERQQRPYTISVNRRLANACIAALVALVVYFAWAADFSSAPTTARQADMSHNLVFFSQQTRQAESAETVPARNEMQDKALTATREKTASPQSGNPTAAAAETAQTPHTSPTKATAKQPYAIVLASSITRQGATRYVEQLRQAGHPEAYVYTTPHMVRVLYSHYATADEAQQALSRMRQLDEFSDAWIICLAP